jgi:hypothetical protein
MAIISEEGHEPRYIIVCFVVHKTISELEHAILTTLFLPVQKTLTRVCWHKELSHGEYSVGGLFCACY